MSITLQVPDKAAREAVKLVKTHYIPATISRSGKAEVDAYFNSYTEKDDSGVLTNSLRGYPLKGCEMKVPDGKVAVIFRETRKPMSDQTDRTLKFSGQFREFTYWNYDLNPSGNDALQKTFETLDVLEAVHKAV